MTETIELTLEVTAACTTPTGHVQRLHGSGDVEAFFAGHDRVIVPWLEAPRRAGRPKIDPHTAHALLAGPPRLVDVDPRILHATQPWVVAHHARYYLTGQWERTGLPSAQRHLASNRYPLIADIDGRAVLYGGHHRALVAQIQGRPLRARVAHTRADQLVAVTPSILVGKCRRPTLHLSSTCVTPDAASAFVERGRTVIVPMPGVAFEALRRLGLDTPEALERLRIAELLASPDQRSPR